MSLRGYGKEMVITDEPKNFPGITGPLAFNVDLI